MLVALLLIWGVVLVCVVYGRVKSHFLELTIVIIDGRLDWPMDTIKIFIPRIIIGILEI